MHINNLPFCLLPDYNNSYNLELLVNFHFTICILKHIVTKNLSLNLEALSIKFFRT